MSPILSYHNRFDSTQKKKTRFAEMKTSPHTLDIVGALQKEADFVSALFMMGFEVQDSV